MTPATLAKEFADRVAMSNSRLEAALLELDKALMEPPPAQQTPQPAAPPGRAPKAKPRPVTPRNFSPRRLPLPKFFSPWDTLTDFGYFLAIPGEFNNNGSGACFTASCSTSDFVGVVPRVNCSVPPPFCFAPLPLPPLITIYDSYQAGLAAIGSNESIDPYAVVYRERVPGVSYVVAEVVGPMAPGEDIGFRRDPIFLPYLDPVSPIYHPMPDPNMQPAQRAVPGQDTLPNPKRDEDEEDWPEYERRRTERRRVIVNPGFAQPRPGGRPGPRPNPQPNPRPSPQPVPFVSPQRPRKGEKEKKAQFRSYALYRVVMALIDTATETQDFVRAIYQALPTSLRCGEVRYGRRGNPYRTQAPAKAGKYDTVKQAEMIYRHADQLDVGQAVLNLIANQVEDNVIGRTQKELMRLSGGNATWEDYGRGAQVRTALRKTQKETQALKKAAGFRGECR